MLIWLCEATNHQCISCRNIAKLPCIAFPKLQYTRVKPYKCTKNEKKTRLCFVSLEKLTNFARCLWNPDKKTNRSNPRLRNQNEKRICQKFVKLPVKSQ